MDYLQSFIRVDVVVPRLKVPTLTDKTNAPPSFRPRKIESKKGLGLRGIKAAATVALTPASTCTQDAVPQSFVPFPSSADEEQDERNDVPSRTSSSQQAENGLKRPLPTETRRKRCQVMPAQSCHGAAPRRRNSLLAVTKPRPAAASPLTAVPCPKRPKKSRRAVADMQFAADVHRSILRYIRAHDEAVMVVDDECIASDVLLEQDRALADRLSKSLHDQGCSPALIEGSAHYAPPSVEITKVEVAVSASEADAAMHGADAAGHAAPATVPAPRSPELVTSLPPPPAQLSRSPTPPPPAVTPAPGSRVYEMPQLVAALHMRRHERAARTRPQSLPASRTLARTPSPLRTTAVVAADASDS